MSLIGRILRWRGTRRWDTILARNLEPGRWQQQLWRGLMSRMAPTVQGRQFGLPDVTDVRSFQQRVPLTRHEDVVDLWNRVLEGEPDVLWPGYTRYFGMTSGTSSSAGSNKYIPLSRDTIRTNMTGGFDVVASYLHHTRDAGLLDAGSHMMFLGGATALTEVPSSHRPGKPNWHGDNTGIAARFMPWWVRRFYSPGPGLAWISDWEQKVQRIAEESRKQDIRIISGVPSWMAILLDRVRELESGKPIGEVWPNLRAFMHGGMSFEPYRDLFHQLIGRDIFYVESYSATEGGMLAVQDQLAGGDAAMMPLVDLGVFFEFVPAAIADQKHPESHTLDRVQTGIDYAVVMTTNAGLCRYVVGDTVKFIEARPRPRMLVGGRLSAFLNFFGEHVIQSEIDSAMTAASHATGQMVKDYTVAPLFPSSGAPVPGHRWYVEFAGASDAVDLAEFSRLIDHDIRNVSKNLDYDSHRKGDIGLRPPHVVPVPPGTFYEWMKRRGKLGGQNKVPRALTDTDLVTSLQALVDETA